MHTGDCTQEKHFINATQSATIMQSEFSNCNYLTLRPQNWTTNSWWLMATLSTDFKNSFITGRLLNFQQTHRIFPARASCCITTGSQKFIYVAICTIHMLSTTWVNRKCTASSSLSSTVLSNISWTASCSHSQKTMPDVQCMWPVKQNMLGFCCTQRWDIPHLKYLYFCL